MAAALQVRRAAAAASGLARPSEQAVQRSPARCREHRPLPALWKHRTGPAAHAAGRAPVACRADSQVPASSPTAAAAPAPAAAAAPPTGAQVLPYCWNCRRGAASAGCRCAGCGCRCPRRMGCRQRVRLRLRPCCVAASASQQRGPAIPKLLLQAPAWQQDTSDTKVKGSIAEDAQRQTRLMSLVSDQSEALAQHNCSSLNDSKSHRRRILCRHMQIC